MLKNIIKSNQETYLNCYNDFSTSICCYRVSLEKKKIRENFHINFNCINNTENVSSHYDTSLVLKCFKKRDTNYKSALLCMHCKSKHETGLL